MIAIDSMVLIYAGIVPVTGKPPSNDRNELSVRAKLLFHIHRHQQFILPTVAISEILIPVPTSQRPVLLAKLSELFICPSFDLPAATIASELWQQHKKLPNDLQYKKRPLLRADVMILASAKVAGATKFYTHDKKLLGLAKLIMPAFDLPKDDPNDMFLKQDIKNGTYEPESPKKRK